TFRRQHREARSAVRVVVKRRGWMRRGWILAVMLAAAAPAAAADDVRLVEAVKRGSDTAVVRSLIEAGAPVNAVEADGATALAWAAHRDDVAAADLLLHAGANPKLTNAYG